MSHIIVSPWIKVLTGIVIWPSTLWLWPTSQSRDLSLPVHTTWPATIWIATFPVQPGFTPTVAINARLPLTVQTKEERQQKHQMDNRKHKYLKLAKTILYILKYLLRLTESLIIQSLSDIWLCLFLEKSQTFIFYKTKFIQIKKQGAEKY